jgi:hypothetical protein
VVKFTVIEVGQTVAEVDETNLILIMRLRLFFVQKFEVLHSSQRSISAVIIKFLDTVV